MSASKMTQGQSSRRVLMGARGKTPSGVASNRHPRKRSFLQMIKSAANTVLLLIFVFRTAHSMHGITKQKKDLLALIAQRQNITGLEEYLKSREAGDYKRSVAHIQKLCAQPNNFMDIAALNLAKSEYLRICEKIKKLHERNTKKSKKKVDAATNAKFLEGIKKGPRRKASQKEAPQKEAHQREAHQRKIPPSSAPSKAPKGNDMTAAKQRIRAMAKASSKQMHAITQEATKRGRERFAKKQQAKKEALEAKIAALIEKIKEADTAKKLRERFLNNVTEFAGDHINDDWDRRGYNDFCLRNLSFQIKKLEMKLQKMNSKLDASQEELHNEFYKIEADKIVGYTGLDNVEERETTD